MCYLGTVNFNNKHISVIANKSSLTQPLFLWCYDCVTVSYFCSSFYLC